MNSHEPPESQPPLQPRESHPPPIPRGAQGACPSTRWGWKRFRNKYARGAPARRSGPPEVIPTPSVLPALPSLLFPPPGSPPHAQRRSPVFPLPPPWTISSRLFCPNLHIPRPSFNFRNENLYLFFIQTAIFIIFFDVCFRGFPGFKSRTVVLFVLPRPVFTIVCFPYFFA